MSKGEEKNVRAARVPDSNPSTQIYVPFTEISADSCRNVSLSDTSVAYKAHISTYGAYRILQVIYHD